MELASFGPVLQWSRCAWIGRMAQSRRALVLGDGDGRFTAQLLRSNRTVTVDAVDASPAMLARLMRRAGSHAERVHPRTGDARLLRPDGQVYDLVVTHFFLDCLTSGEVQSLARAVREAVDGRALWVVSEFAIPPSRFGRSVAHPVVAALYRAFGWLTGLRVRSLPDYASGLGEAGFALEDCRTWLGGLLRSEIWALREPAGNVTGMLKSAE
jgi:ubiquinone/menaquinone biosynthesis C-methylase UbiE